jgi:hypothetical protein
VGGLAAARALPRTQPRVPRPSRSSRAGPATPRADSHSTSRDLLRSLLDWTRFLFAESRLAEAEDGADLGLQKGAAHPDFYGRFVLGRRPASGPR